ncbi:putative methanogen marker protein 4 [Methanofollis sp. W23]|uniref:methanogenesis marker protein Mmp4/MtxX n=1 Tax=Methanofollis sp. W23 TaxID=2817849 RepID=UPI001AEAB558|nr:methanogenesis marker protein Mmp4/MtxX [Methanofollis sp. W23]MBP2144860.1 putative methanogen marker protein 4 [Methanofollis sp. W23]
MSIGIGAGADPEKVAASVRKVGNRLQVVCYCCPGAMDGLGVETRESECPWEMMVDDLLAGRIEGAVRGTLPANETLRCLKAGCGVDHLERVALLESANGVQFLFAPVGVDEGWTVAEKLAFVEKARPIARAFGLSAGVAVLSGGRYGDVGRHQAVDRSLADAELVARLAGAEHCEVRIEDAVQECGVVIAPDGITGNLIFRTLTFLGGGAGHGAPVVNIGPIFVDSSRASPDYSSALLLASSMIKSERSE